MQRIRGSGPPRASGNVIDFGSRLAKRAKALKRDIPVFDTYDIPSSLAGRDKSVTSAAEFDAESARKSAINMLASFLQDNENLDRSLDAILGTDAGTQPREKRAVLSTVNELFGYDGLSEGLFPRFKVMMPAPADSILSAMASNLMPDDVAMAYVVSPGRDDEVLLSTGIGFKDMHTQSEIAVVMSVIERVRSNGVAIDTQSSLARMVRVMEKNSARLNGPAAPDIDVLTDGQLIRVPPERYTKDFDLVTR